MAPHVSSRRRWWALGTTCLTVVLHRPVRDLTTWASAFVNGFHTGLMPSFSRPASDKHRAARQDFDTGVVDEEETDLQSFYQYDGEFGGEEDDPEAPLRNVERKRHRAQDKPGNFVPRRNAPYRGYWDRRDLPQVDIQELDADGELQQLSLEELESRAQRLAGQKKRGLRPQSPMPADSDDQQKPPTMKRRARQKDMRNFKIQTEMQQRPIEQPEDSASLRERRESGFSDKAPWQTQGGTQSWGQAGNDNYRRQGARVFSQEPSEEVGEVDGSTWGSFPPMYRQKQRGSDVIDYKVAQGVKEGTERAKQGKPRPKLSDWLMPSANAKQKQTAKERLQDMLETSSSSYEKMYKDVIRRMDPLPWELVEGKLNWNDPAPQTWEELGVNGTEGQKLVQRLSGIGIVEPNVLQARTIPLILRGRDLLLTSSTGTGKTLAFLIPLLQAYILPLANTVLKPPRDPTIPTHKIGKVKIAPKVLVVSPTRELAGQIHGVVRKLLKPFPNLNSTLLIGGANHNHQSAALKEDYPMVVVGTPGRIIDHATEGGRLILSELKAVVLDEIDMLLRMSRQDHMEMLKIRTNWRSRGYPQQKIFVSASGALDVEGAHFTKRNLQKPWNRVGPKNGLQVPPRVLHLVNHAPDMNKRLLFMKRLATSKPAPDGMLVFCNNYEKARKVAEQLQWVGIPADVLSSNRSKTSRHKAIKNMLTGRVDVLVATDVATRGLDFQHITHVINFELPGDVVTYAHRAGRCGRMGRNGIVISLASGGANNLRLNGYADELNITLLEANVQNNFLGIVGQKPSQRVRR